MTSTPHPRSSIARYFFVGLFIIALTGCATKRSLPPPNALPSGASRVIFIRKGSMVGGAQRIKLFDTGKVYAGGKLCSETDRELSKNGWLIGTLGASGTLTWDRAPGPMMLTLQLLTLFGGAGDQVVLEAIFTEPNKEYTVELGSLTDIYAHKPPKVSVRDLP